jgi:hypothetical protein
MRRFDFTAEGFDFCGELFEIRNSVFDALAENDFVYLENFGGVDVLHDIYGFEIVSIDSERNAKRIEKVMKKIYPKWYLRRHYEDLNQGEIGWKVIVSRKRESFDKNAKSSSPQQSVVEIWCRACRFVFSIGIWQTNRKGKDDD